MTEETLTRRRALAGLVAGASLAGCLSDDASNAAGSGGTGGTGDESGVRLGDVVVVNEDDESHTLHVLVYRNDERVNWSTHEVAARDDGRSGGARVEATWSDEPASYVIVTRFDGADDWHEWPLGEDAGGCLDAMLRVERDGSLKTWTSRRECGDGAGGDGVADEEA